MTSWPTFWGSRGVEPNPPDGGSGQYKADLTLKVGNQSWMFERDQANSTLYQVYTTPGRSYAGFVNASYLHDKQEVARALDGMRDRLPSWLPNGVLLAMLQQLNQQQRGG
ncbi:MAG: hypothetical protein ACAI38_09065 [Myxococcota bacterium]